MYCQIVEDVGHLSRITVEDSGTDLLVLADSPRGRDLDALLGLFQRVLGGTVPHLLLTYAARRPEQKNGCVSCLNKPFSAEALVAAALAAVDSKPAAEPPSASAAPEPETASNPLAGLRVLVAEDNEIAAKVIVTLLSKQGADVTRVGDGEQALIRAREEDFALAFVDLRMPGLDGMEFTRTYRGTETGESHLPIVALTADAAEDFRTDCLAAGMDDFLGKPVKPDELIAMARRVATTDFSSAGEGS
jgi:two-component system sensor histidine kinase RpfC